jgi:Co/Zn/Cd efflux system component
LIILKLSNHCTRLEPPEMNTNQLLLVSSLGLGVNLFGMFAMGGHHHHVCHLCLQFEYCF